MINPNQFLAFPYFCNYIDPHSFFLIHSTQNHHLIPGRILSQYHGQASNINFQAKSLENQDFDTQKHESLSLQQNQRRKCEAFLYFQQNIGLQEEQNKQKMDVQSNIAQRNETKNISKNFGKAILSFAKSNSKISKRLLRKYDVEKQELVNYIKQARKDLNSLQDLRQMWGADDEKDNLKKCLRIISHHFMRKHCLSYIFNSRVKSVSAHTKYRHRLMKGMSRPSEFKNIKLN